MAEDKKGFILYADIIGMVKKLPDDKAGLLFKHILKYVNDENPITDDLIVDISFEPIKAALKRDLEKYERIKNRNSRNGKKGGRPKKDNPEKPKKPTGLFGNPEKPQKAVSDSVSDSVSVSDKDKENIIKDILFFWSFEYANPNHAKQNRDALSFVNLLIKSDRIQYFKKQFEAYRIYHKGDQAKFKHKFHNYIGDIGQDNGKWQDENWIEKNKGKPKDKISPSPIKAGDEPDVTWSKFKNK